MTVAADFDVQLQIEAILHDLNIPWDTHHVKGHQTGPDLSWEAQLNNRADELATEAKKNLTRHTAETIQHKYPAAKAHLTINNRLITRKFDNEIQESYTTILIKNDMCKRFDWSNAKYNTIDWQTHGTNMIKLGFYRHKFIVKLIHERLPLQGVSYNPSATTKCPCCSAVDETEKHFMHCQHNEEKWSNVIPQLTTIYNKTSVDPVLRILINISMTEIPLPETLKIKHPHVNVRPYI
jgi:hypothetical protein